MKLSIFKKIACLMLAFVFIFSLLSCGASKKKSNENSESDTSANTSTNTNTDTSTNTNTDTGSGENENKYPETAFKVTLEKNGQAYIPQEEITAFWTGEDDSVHSATFDEYGVAWVDGLDGDYMVTLSHTPNKIAYNPNDAKNHTATNDNRDVVIELFDIIQTQGTGAKLYSEIQIHRVGVYQVTLKSASHTVYYEFAPRETGMYTVESWMDTTAELYNPYCESYTGQAVGALYHTATIDGGGAEGIYTKNFKNGININKELLGNVLVYGIHVDAKNAESYPVTVTFALDLNGEYDVVLNTEGDMYVPKEDMSDYWNTNHEYGSDYELVGAEKPIEGRENAFIYDERNYKLWSKDAGGDGFYHVYDKEKYPETGGYGPILYAHIYSPTPYFDSPISSMEMAGNKCLTITLDGEKINYKHYIEGYSKLASRNESEYNGGSYYCSEYCICHTGQDHDLACTEDCTSCHEDCRRIKPELIYNEGLKKYQNSDGMVAVTEEVKTFLFKFSRNSRYFADGEGNCELNGLTKIIDGNEVQCSIDSDDESQWLFACAYYVKK